MSKSTAPAIGIDLGTTYSRVSVFQNGSVQIIPNEIGSRTTSNYVVFTDTVRLIGDPAKSQVSLNPENTVFDAKRMIGRQYNDPTIQSDKKYWPFTVIEERGKLKISVQYNGEKKSFYPEELSAMVLSKLKRAAETFLGQEVKDAVITVPANFNDSQRQATIDAGKIAGLNVLKIINEPTAAALAYGLDKKEKGERNFLIFDLGGGTFDVTVLTMAEGSFFTALSTAGNTHLGGKDFDNRLVSYFSDKFKREFSKDFNTNPISTWRLRSACERAKRMLSSSTETKIELDLFFDNIDFSSKISRTQFEELCMDLFRSTIKSVEKAIKDAQIEKSNIHNVVLVGGSTQMPTIQNLLKNFFNGKDLCMSINPDEAVAYGAAVQAAISLGVDSKNIRDVTVVDVTPLSLGIAIPGGVISKIIQRNTKIPYKTSQTKDTDNQQQIEIEIYEGEGNTIKDNHYLGMFRLEGVPSVPQIEVTFDIDENGILEVSAQDLSSGSSQSITITNERGRLSKDEIDRIAQKSQKYEKEAKMKRERIEAKTLLESYIYTVTRTVELSASDLSPDDKTKVLNICQEVMQWLKKNQLADKDEINDKKEEVEKQLIPILTRISEEGPSDLINH